ncbi:PAS domain S-box protein [bacterium]|nr:PAS domain S-box protein [bacterium]
MNPERPKPASPIDPALRFAWLPILLVIVLIPLLWTQESRGAYVSLPLAAGMNIFGRTLVAVLIAILAGRSFLVSGRPELLLLGCGIGIWGMTGTISISLGCFRPSAGMTVASLGVLLSGLCHMIGVKLSIRAKPIARPDLWLWIGYSLASLTVCFIAVTEIAGMLPTFFIEDTGGTAIRHVVLGSAVAMFVLAAIVLRAENRPSQSSFTQWYSYALLMIAAGQLGMMIESSRFSMLAWMCRVTQSVGALYMLIAVIASVRETGTWGISLVEALRESEERFRLFMDNSPTIAWIKDAAGRNVYANKTFLNRFRMSREEITGKTDAELSNIDDETRHRNRDLETIEADRPLEFTERFKNPDGTVGDWIVIKFPLRDSQGTQYVAGIGLEVTERKAAEKQLKELNQALEQRVHERTRELKNTIRQLQVLAQKLTEAEEHERGRLAEVLHDDLQQVLVAAKLYLARVGMPHGENKTSGLIEDTDHLLDEAILITRNLSHELSPPFFSQQDLIATLKWLCWQFKSKYDLTVHFSDNGAIEINDALKVFLFRAAREILFNIVKHAEVREAKMEIHHLGSELEMTIADQGKGFDTGRFGSHSWIGSGFGLFSIQERAGLMGGNLKIDSEPGRGSVFTMRVPVSMLAGIEDGDGTEKKTETAQADA